jgi:hypothetical protein
LIEASDLRILKEVNGETWNHPNNAAFRFRAIDLLNASRVESKKIKVGEINALLDSVSLSPLHLFKKTLLED